MSLRGPPESCATVTHPAACISTTPMPKCSFHIVWMPTAAVDSQRSSSSYSSFTRNSTSSPTLRPSSAHTPRRWFTSASSPSLRTPPTSTSRGVGMGAGRGFGSRVLRRSVVSPPDGDDAAAVRRRRSVAKARICSSWSFSGRNWPTLSTTGSRGLSAKPERSLVFTGGYRSITLEPQAPHMSSMCAFVHDELAMQRTAKEPQNP
mmetsp:Transcript_23855/g.75092  ORF Transcript_23855/g.75092 Transcript_23855/m.75092 type:complete len:205 (-) Transcript_23855:919-1533(-)